MVDELFLNFLTERSGYATIWNETFLDIVGNRRNPRAEIMARVDELVDSFANDYLTVNTVR